MSERFWEDIETGYIYDHENNDFDPVKTLNKQSNEIIELKQQLADKDKEIERLKEANEHLDKHNLELAYALTEKPKQHELYELRLDNKILKEDRDNYVKARLKDQRHKICERIREKILEQLELPDEEWVWCSDNYAGVSLIKQILDQTEKGEDVDNKRTD